MGQRCWAAPSADDLAKFGEMERTIKELTSSILAMSGASPGRFISIHMIYISFMCIFISGFSPGDRNANNVWPEDLQA